jgi:hypothetical protein
MADAEIEQERRSVENAVNLQNHLRDQVLSKAERARLDRQRQLQEAKEAAQAREREDQIFEVLIIHYRSSSLHILLLGLTHHYVLLCYHYSNMHVNIWMNLKRKVVQ